MAQAVSALPNSTTDRARQASLPTPTWLRAGMRAASAVAPGAAARLVRALFFRPPRSRAQNGGREILAPVSTFSIQVRGRNVRGYTWGAGPAVLLVHGWGGHVGHMGGFVDPLVRSGCRVVAVDLPGHGRSDGRISSLVHGSDAIEKLDGLYGPFVGVVAHSFGAPIVTYAMSRGVSADRLVFVAPAARFEPYWERFRDAIGTTPEVMARFVADAEERLRVRFDGIATADLAPSMDTPLLIVHSADDRQIPVEEGALLADCWPGAELRKVDGLGHIRVLWDQELIDEAVQFLHAPARV